jgi:hypothetical protein
MWVARFAEKSDRYRLSGWTSEREAVDVMYNDEQVLGDGSPRSPCRGLTESSVENGYKIRLKLDGGAEHASSRSACSREKADEGGLVGT